MQRTALTPVSGLVLLFSAAMLWAQQAQDWIPESLTLPPDMEVIVDRAIGSSTRIFSFATGEDPAKLIDGWTQALGTAGFTIAPSSDAIDTQQIEFSGPGIGNAKIAIQPTAEAGRTVVQFDASLN